MSRTRYAADVALTEAEVLACARLAQVALDWANADYAVRRARLAARKALDGLQRVELVGALRKAIAARYRQTRRMRSLAMRTSLP